MDVFVNNETDIENILRDSGPITGADLSARLPHLSEIAVWRSCHMSTKFRVTNCARYYLRYDILRDNQLRLSPSILRDFLTFSLIYLPEQIVEKVEAGTRLANQFRSISLEKLSWAREALLQLDPELQKVLIDHCVVFLSGDIAYFLAHETMRQHRGLGVPIKGSDIDIVIITNNEAPKEAIERIESEFLTIKKIFLMTPHIREELDFIVKPIDKMLAQLAYSDIHEKIASKILYESYFLMGRVDVYQKLIQHLRLSGTWDRIEADFEIALGQRKETIRKILALSPDFSIEDKDVASLFFASKERLEFT